MSLLFFLFYTLANSKIPEQSELFDDGIYIVENSQHIESFLKAQDYYYDVSSLCHEDDCYSFDVFHFERSMRDMEEKVFQTIYEEYGEEAVVEARLKGFSINKVLTH